MEVSKEQIKKIKDIIEREIEKELNSKQDEVANISEKIKTVLRNLELLKYIVAVNYYDQNSTLAPKKNQEDENEEEKNQNQIHPCIKKLMPFRSNYNKLCGETNSSHSYITRNTKKVLSSEMSSDNSKNEISKNSNECKDDNKTSNLKTPQYIPPLPSTDENVIKVNSSRGSVSRELYKIVIGNVSKWIPPDTREGNSTHKWMVYIRTKDSSNKDITKQLRKVRYFLHESYKPHDIIDLTSPPFHLTRRGWGEFPVRVQLHFTHPLNKPVDIIHNLKLDMTCSGIQMLGAETVVSVSLHQSEPNENGKDSLKTDPELKMSTSKEENVKEKQDVFDGSLLTSLNGIKFNNCDISIEQENNSCVVIKQEPEEEFDKETIYDSKSEDDLPSSRNYLLDRRKVIKTIEIEHNYMKIPETSSNKSFNNLTDSVLKLEVLKNQNNGEKPLKNGALTDSVHLSQKINKKSQDCLNKFDFKASRSEEEVFKNLKAVVNKLETETQSKYSMKSFRNMYMVYIVQRAHATKLKTVESLIKWFVQRWPIITKLSLDPFYKTIHPYSAPSEEEFLKYNIGKQRSAEWFRAKAIQKVLTSLKPLIVFDEEIWSTKQILLWSRHHGYSPLSFQKTAKTETVETSEIKNKRLKSNDSSSDSDENNWEIPDKKSRPNGDFFNGVSMKDRKKNFKKSRKKESTEEIVDVHKNYKNLKTYTEANDPNRFGNSERRVLHCADSDSEIEVVEIEKESPKESPSKKQNVNLAIVATPPGERPFHRFVCDTARQIGVKIFEEELIPDVKCDSVSRVLSHSVCNFLEELLRRSFSHAWRRNGERCPESLELNDILTTLIENNRFDLFTNRGLGISDSEKS